MTQEPHINPAPDTRLAYIAMTDGGDDKSQSGPLQANQQSGQFAHPGAPAEVVTAPTLAIENIRPKIGQMQMAFHVVFDAPHPGPCRERALVLQSQGIRSETVVNEGRYQLVVTEADLADARSELSSYQRENTGWKPHHRPMKFDYQVAWPGLLGYVLLMLLAGWAAGDSLGGFNWFTSGKVDASLVRGGEWWRTVTALTLHADLAHLSGNLFFGVAFGFFASQFFGPGVAWFGILLSGAFGNLLNSYLQSSSHTSVGASTAIFGALGLVAAFSWKRKFYPQDRWAYRIGPVVGGIALLAFTGTGGERTDVGAHVTGFVCGFVIALALAAWPQLINRRGLSQWLTGFGALAIVAASWFLALNR